MLATVVSLFSVVNTCLLAVVFFYHIIAQIDVMMYFCSIRRSSVRLSGTNFINLLATSPHSYEE